ncbi:MAG TPA: hypothetical protein VK826_17070 [Bacteroidia bacterium]|nr:hypothetical protein [Bacteroidia bacterium]
MKLALVILFVFLLQICSAQNRILVLHAGDSIGNILRIDANAENPRWSDFDYNVPPTPAGVIAALPVKCDFQKAADASLTRFQRSHLVYIGPDAGRDFLDAGYDWYHEEKKDQDGYEEYDPAADSANRESLKKSIFGSKVLRELLYTWLMPSYRDAFSIMSVPEQRAYLLMLEEAKIYADTFSVEKEKRRVANVENYASEVGSLNAFIYRRVANNEITRDECTGWINRMIKDLEPAQKQNPSEADDYVLLEHLGYGYYSAVDHLDADGYGAQYVIIRKVNEQYSVLPVPKFSTAQLDEPDTNFVIGYRYENKQRHRYVFYCDSSCWLFTETAYAGYPRQHVVLGSGKSARFLMIDAVDYDYKDPDDPDKEMTICSVVDADSGTVVIDSIYIPRVSYEVNFELITKYPELSKERIIFYHAVSKKYGIMDRYGNILVQPKYKSIEATADPNVFRVNGRKKLKLK